MFGPLAHTPKNTLITRDHERRVLRSFLLASQVLIRQVQGHLLA